MKKIPQFFLNHILENITKIEKSLIGVNEIEFSRNVDLQDAIIRRFEVIGEATKNLPIDFKQNQNHIDWRQIAGIRDNLIHEYFRVDMSIVWETTQRDLPILKKQVENILQQV